MQRTAKERLGRGLLRGREMGAKQFDIHHVM